MQPIGSRRHQKAPPESIAEIEARNRTLRRRAPSGLQDRVPPAEKYFKMPEKKSVENGTVKELLEALNPTEDN